ncbi:MAG: hypothetical protein AABX07_00355 [Nanoarchaeota archaeon]
MEKIEVQFIIEILGRPPAHITEALNTMLQKMSNEKGIKIINKIVHKPIPVKDTKDLFTAFAEINAELDSLANYFGIIFSYFPANIEIISPEELKIRNSVLNEVGNALVHRLHEYDALAKKLVAENEILLGKLKEVAPHLFPQEPQQAQQQVLSSQKKKPSKKLKVKSKNVKKGAMK